MGLRVAALCDVHGNLPALEATLADVEREAPDVVVFGGDLIWGGWPEETLELALSLGDRARFVRGNTDRSALTSDEASAVWTRERLSEGQRAVVLAWPTTVVLDVDGLGPSLFCHATPRNDAEIVSPVSAVERWVEALDGVSEPVVVCGHTHLRYDGRYAGRRVVNPGSVGNPSEEARAWWALLGPDVELRASDYDTAATAAALRATGFPRLELADELLQPWSRERLLAELAALG